MKSHRLQKRIQAALTPDLLHKKYRHLAAEHPHAGHCYVAAEALYHALGGERSGYKPVNIHWEGGPHWFLQHQVTGKVLDPTVGQFETPVPYHTGTRKGFLTKQPSKRAQEVLRRAGLAEGYVAAAAIRHRGQIFTAPSHDGAIDAMVRAGHLKSFHDYFADQGEEGFVTHDGRFVNRQEALTLATQADQLKHQRYATAADKELDSDYVKRDNRYREAVSESSWAAPKWDRERSEVVRVSKETGLPFEKLRRAFNRGKVAPVSDDHFRDLENTDANSGEHKSVDSVHHMAQSYGGKDSVGIHKALTKGETLPAPIILHRPGKSPTLVAGNTRLTMAAALGQRAHALHINVDESRADRLISHYLREGVVLSGDSGSKRLMTLALQYGYQETGEPEVSQNAVTHKLIDPKTGYTLQVRRLLRRDRGLDLDQNLWKHQPTNELGTDPEHLSQVLRLATRNARSMA